MKKAPSQKRQAIKRLKEAIRESRKIARQINRKLESLATWNKIVEMCKAELRKICGIK